ncbi:unnamed protein product [Sphenostylis stenocarpa]|uniref:Maternal effect embryo arrest 22 n=1 Tax=Sphenostylis stenocarpa TaxID=92480 RepID=A0AA86SRM4_9FABA|nr:unnamed protein product [Sphenostylis stenocarpa]
MTMSMNRDRTLKSDPTNPCCDHWKKKYSKVQESRNALRQAVKVLEVKINEIQSRSSNACGAKVERGDKLGEFTAAGVPLGSETSSFEPQIDTSITQQGCGDRGNENGTLQVNREKEICILKELLAVEKGRADSERKKAAEACKLLEDEKNKAAEKENEICRLKGLLDVEKKRANSESKKAAEACKLVGEEKKKVAEKDKEIGRLKVFIETEKIKDDSKRKKDAEVCKLLGEEKNKVAEKEKEIVRLKELLEEKIRADSERKQDNEVCRLLGEEKNKVAEKEKEICRLKELLEDKRRAESERKKDNEVFKLLEEEKNKVAEKEKEISRLKELLEENKKRANSERKQDNEVCKLLGEEKKKVAEKEKEISRLKELLEENKRKADFERKKDNEVCKLIGEEKNKVAEKEKDISRLKELLEENKRRADSERKKDNEVCILLGEEKKKVAEKEKEIGRLKELLDENKRRADSERKKDNEVCKLIGEEKKKVAEKEKEISRLNELLEENKRRDDSERKKDNEICMLLGEEKNKVAEKDKEIGRLKELLEENKRRADSERKKASKACKLLEEEKNKTAESGEIARVEVEKGEKYRTQIGQLEKQVNEAKAKLVSEIFIFKEATKKFEAEKRKLLAEKRNADSGMAKANEMLEIEKQKVDKEKRRADEEMAKLEGQKALAEDNWNKFRKEKCLADQMSQKLEEDKKTIEDLKQKINELSSLTKPVEMVADNKVKGESTEMKLLKNKLKLEKLRAKHTRQKYKLEASQYSILRNELGRLKLDFIQFLHRLDMLDAAFSPVAGSKHDQKKYKSVLDMQNSNAIRQIGNLNLSEMRSQFENELLEPCCTTIDASDPLRKKMQNNTPRLTPGGNCSESITGIGSKLEPLVRGSYPTKLQSSAVNSSTESFSDGQLMGSQDANIFPVTASAQLTQEILNAKQNMSEPSDKSVDVRYRKRKKMHDTVDYIATLSSEKLSDLHGLLYRKLGKCLGGKEVFHNLNNLDEENKRAHKKRKKSRREKGDTIPWINRDEKKGTEETNIKVYDGANVCRQTSCPAPHNLETTKVCGERICDSANNINSIINFDEVPDEGFMKLVELENAYSEECYRKAMDFPLSPSLPDIEFHETFEEDNLMIPSLEKSLPEDMLGSRIDVLISPSSDVMNAAFISNAQKCDDCGVSCNSHMQTTENSRTAFPVEDGIGSLNNEHPEFCVVFSNVEDNSIISRILTATKSCIAQCNLATQTGWAVSSILTALTKEEKLSQKEKVSVLLTLMLFNFTMTATKTFGRLWDGKSFRCLRSYSEHICTVMSDAEIRILFVENYSLHELLGLIEDFLIQGKVIVKNRVDADTLSSGLRATDFLDCANEVSPDVASSEQLVAASVILASLCAATDYVGFICDASYHILRLGKLDSLMVLIILHIFSYLGGEKFFNLDNFGLMVTVLKSLIVFLEDGNRSVATACLPSINQLHSELCMTVKCPFMDGAESIDAVACLLLEEIKRVDLSDSRLVSVSAIDKDYDVPCSRKCLISATQPDTFKNVNFRCLSDVLSLVELVANKMSWHWADMILVPQLLNILDSCVEENFAIRIIVLLGQLGRTGVDVGGFEDQGVGKLRCYLFAYFCRISSMKADLFLQFAAASALFGLLPLDFETLFDTNINLSAYSKSVSDSAETLRKWFSGLGKDQQKLLSDVYSK